MSDVIYRQDAIIAVRAHRIDINDPKKIVRKSYEDVIRELPSAEPEIIHCKDCKHYYFADNRITQEQRYSCALDGDRWNPDSFCSFAERRGGQNE